MDIKDMLDLADRQAVVRNNLLHREQTAYCLAWNSMIGQQKKVIYNAMGPDLSTALLLTNPLEIIGIDRRGIYENYLEEYITKYWDLVDKKPILKAGAFWYYDKKNTAESYTATGQQWQYFELDQNFRKEHGYWDLAHINRWDIERLLSIEFKKLGVSPNDMKIFVPSNPARIHFNWPYPQAAERKRKLTYIGGTLTGCRHKFFGIDCFYQKSLPEPEDTLQYITAVLPAMKKDATVIIGHLFDHNRTWKSNNLFCRAIQKTLGKDFKRIRIDSAIESLIDDIPDDSIEPRNLYGMKLFVFKRAGLAV